MEKNWEKFFKKLEEKSKNPFENYPIGVWHSQPCYFCPDCGKPVWLCTCPIKTKAIKIKKVKVD